MIPSLVNKIWCLGCDVFALVVAIGTSAPWVLITHAIQSQSGSIFDLISTNNDNNQIRKSGCTQNMKDTHENIKQVVNRRRTDNTIAKR